MLGWAAVITVVLILFTRLEQMRQENQNLQMSVAEIRYDVNRQINGIAGRVENILQSQNTLTAEQSAEISATDYRANTITVSARALPRTYVEGMTAEFILVSGGETVTVPGELGDSHTFTAQLTGPLSDSVTVSAVFLTGDQRQTQLLKRYSDLYSGSFPDVRMFGGDLWGSGAKIKEYAHVRINEREAARIASIRLGLFRDKELLVWYEHLDEQPSNYYGDWPDTEFFRLDGEWTMEPGYEYCQAAVVVDEYGRERVYPSRPVVYDAERGLTDYADSENYYISDDPVNWNY